MADRDLRPGGQRPDRHLVALLLRCPGGHDRVPPGRPAAGPDRRRVLARRSRRPRPRRSSISSLRDWASTVALWNLALDPTGGPVQVPNHGCPGCVGLATVDEHTGTASLTRSYYQLGQASAYVDPGAQRIASNHFVAYTYPRAASTSSPPGSTTSPSATPMAASCWWPTTTGAPPPSSPSPGRACAFRYALPAGAMVTFVLAALRDRDEKPDGTIHSAGPHKACHAL